LRGTKGARVEREVSEGAPKKEVAASTSKGANKAGATPKKKLQPGTSEHKAARWKEYQERGGEWSYERWSKQYDTNMENVSRGLTREASYRESMGGTSETIKTPYTDRQVDIFVAEKNYMGQLKTGKEALTQDNILAIKKDAWLVKEGNTVEHILEQGATKPYLKALDDAGIKYTIGPKTTVPPLQ